MGSISRPPLPRITQYLEAKSSRLGIVHLVDLRAPYEIINDVS